MCTLGPGNNEYSWPAAPSNTHFLLAQPKATNTSSIAGAHGISSTIFWYACLCQFEIDLGAHGQALEKDAFRRQKSADGTTRWCLAHASASHV